jgi:microcystin-dependent protein
MEAFIGQIILFAGGYSLRGWIPCEGQLLPPQQNAALFAVIGTTYGGDGRTTFALPDLRSAAPIGVGKAPGLDPTKLGEKGRFQQTTEEGAGQKGTLGLTYLICVEGMFPPRP